jgi:hypothetical protein
MFVQKHKWQAHCHLENSHGRRRVLFWSTPQRCPAGLGLAPPHALVAIAPPARLALQALRCIGAAVVWVAALHLALHRVGRVGHTHGLVASCWAIRTLRPAALELFCKSNGVGSPGCTDRWAGPLRNRCGTSCIGCGRRRRRRSAWRRSGCSAPARSRRSLAHRACRPLCGRRTRCTAGRAPSRSGTCRRGRRRAPGAARRQPPPRRGSRHTRWGWWGRRHSSAPCRIPKLVRLQQHKGAESRWAQPPVKQGGRRHGHHRRHRPATRMCCLSCRVRCPCGVGRFEKSLINANLPLAKNTSPSVSKKARMGEAGTGTWLGISIGLSNQ